VTGRRLGQMQHFLVALVGFFRIESIVLRLQQIYTAHCSPMSMQLRLPFFANACIVSTANIRKRILKQKNGEPKLPVVVAAVLLCCCCEYSPLIERYFNTSNPVLAPRR
jgi:hypothetical protein